MIRFKTLKPYHKATRPKVAIGVAVAAPTRERGVVADGAEAGADGGGTEEADGEALVWASGFRRLVVGARAWRAPPPSGECTFFRFFHRISLGHVTVTEAAGRHGKAIPLLHASVPGVWLSPMNHVVEAAVHAL